MSVKHLAGNEEKIGHGAGNGARRESFLSYMDRFVSGQFFIKEVPSYANSFWYSLGFLNITCFLLLLLSGLIMVAFGPLWWDANPTGVFIRSIHMWAAVAFLFFVCLHAFVVFSTSGFRKPRRLIWFIGALMLFIIAVQVEFGFGLRGDFGSQYRALAAADFWNGNQLGSLFNVLDYSQLYGVHTAIIPIILIALIAVHYSLVKMHGLSTPYRKDIPYRMVKADHMALFMRGIAAVAVITFLALEFPSPFVPPVTIQWLAQTHPTLVATTLISELNHSSGTATYFDGIDPYTFDTRNVFVITPYSQYSGSQDSGSVDYIYGGNWVVAGSIGVGSQPLDVALSANGNWLAIGNNNGDSVSIISPATNTVIKMLTGFPTKVAYVDFTPDNGLLLVDYDSAQMRSYYTSNWVLQNTYTTGNNPAAIMIAPNSLVAWVANNHDNTVDRINLQTTQITDVIPIPTCPYPWGGSITPNGSVIMLTSNSGSNVIAIYASNDNIETTVSLGNKTGGIQPQMLAFTASNVVINSSTHNTMWALTPDLMGNNVSVISEANDVVASSINVGQQPVGITYSGNFVYAFVSNYGAAVSPPLGTISVIRLSDLDVVHTIDVGTQPQGIVYDNYSNTIYAANAGNNMAALFTGENSSVQANDIASAFSYFGKNGTISSSPNVTNPVISMVGSLVLMAQSGLYQDSLTNGAYQYGNQTLVLRFLSDTGYIDQYAGELGINLSDYGMVKDENDVPSSFLLAPVNFIDNTILENDSSQDRDNGLFLGLLMLLILAVPVTPFVKDLPDRLGLYKLFWIGPAVPKMKKSGKRGRSR